MSMEALGRAATGIAAAGQPQAGLAALDAALAEAVGHRLCTLLVLDAARGVSRRAYSSRPEAYPVLGEKPLRRDTEFHRLVVEEGRPRFCRDRADIIRAFPDHALILSLGCEGAVNLPVRWNGQTLGALNLLHDASHYDEAQAPLLSIFAALAVAPVLRILADAPP